jgi:hypothetical protein
VQAKRDRPTDPALANALAQVPLAPGQANVDDMRREGGAPGTAKADPLSCALSPTRSPAGVPRHDKRSQGADTRERLQNTKAAVENRELVLLRSRNRSAFEALAQSERNRQENEDLEARFTRILSSPAIPLRERVRMPAITGVVGARA